MLPWGGTADNLALQFCPIPAGHVPAPSAGTSHPAAVEMLVWEQSARPAPSPTGLCLLGDSCSHRNLLLCAGSVGPLLTGLQPTQSQGCAVRGSGTHKTLDKPAGLQAESCCTAARLAGTPRGPRQLQLAMTTPMCWAVLEQAGGQLWGECSGTQGCCFLHCTSHSCWMCETQTPGTCPKHKPTGDIKHTSPQS